MDCKVIAIRQPWAWLIVNGFKDIENRSWKPQYRGPLLIQASANLPSKREFEEIRAFVRARRVRLPAEFNTGGIVGMVRLEDCVTASRSKWFERRGFGWVLSYPRKLPFTSLKGRLGLFDPPKHVVARLGLRK